MFDNFIFWNMLRVMEHLTGIIQLMEERGVVSDTEVCAHAMVGELVRDAEKFIEFQKVNDPCLSVKNRR